jgi:hypothetical protein
MKRCTSPIKSTKRNEAKGARLQWKIMQECSCRQRRATCKHSLSRKIDQTKRNKITPTNEEVHFTHQKPQSEMKRRELDSCGKAGR